MELKYSIDKIKIIVSGYEVGYLQELGNNLFTNSRWNENIRKQYETNNITKCFNAFELSHLEGKMYVGFSPNWIKAPGERERAIVIEYNPNKVSLCDFPLLDGLLLQKGITIKVMSVDVACDMFGIDISDLLIHKWHGSVKEFVVIGNKKETHNLGDMGHGHIKFYDKAKEQKVVDLKWTRFEITLKDLGFYKQYDIKSFKMPDVSLVGDVQLDMFGGFNSLSNREKYYLVNYINYPEGIIYLDVKTRKKVLELAATNLKPVEISTESILRTVLDFDII